MDFRLLLFCPVSVRGRSVRLVCCRLLLFCFLSVRGRSEFDWMSLVSFS